MPSVEGTCGHPGASWPALACVDKQNEIGDEDLGKVSTRLLWNGSSGQHLRL